MNVALPAGRLLLPAILSTFVLGAIAPAAALAELTNGPLLGPGLRSRPAYDGSATQRTELVPVIRYFGEHLFARSTQGVLEGGARVRLAPGLHVGAQLAYEAGRKTDDSDFLKNRGMASVDDGASVGVHLEWDRQFGPMPVTLLGRVRQHTDSDRGAQADLRLSAGVFQKGPFAAGVFVQTTWANAKSTGSFYDVTPQAAAASGLPAFAAGSGWLFASAGVLWSVDINPRWVVVGSVESRHLRGDAARSPLAAKTSNRYVSAGLAYRF